MRLLVFMGPPRCGLRAIASHLSLCTGAFTCPFDETHSRLERLLEKTGALVRFRVTRGHLSLPASSCRLRLGWEESHQLFSSFVEEARRNGSSSETFAVVPERLLLPFASSMSEHLADNVQWVWVRRHPKEVERSCVATRWMPRLSKGRWAEYTSDLQVHADLNYERMPEWQEILSDPLFKGDSSQLSSLAGLLGCSWEDHPMGGIYASRK